MAQNTLFNDDGTGIDPEKNYYEELVGEDKKFKTPEDLARGKAESDAFISTIQDENAALRNEIAKRDTIQDFMDKLKTEKSTDPLSTEKTDPSEEEVPQALTETQVERIVAEEVERRSKEQTNSQNIAQVQNTLRKEYGPGYAQVLKEKAASLGVGEDFVEGLAATHPTALYSLLGINTEAHPAPSAPSRPGTITNPGTVRSNRKNYAYFKEKYRDNPDKIYSFDVQKEMMEHIAEQGDSFYE